MSSLVNIGADPFLGNIPQHRAMRPAIAFLNSTLAPDSVSALVGDAYGVDGACTLHYRGTHDTYRLQHGPRTMRATNWPSFATPSPVAWRSRHRSRGAMVSGSR